MNKKRILSRLFTLIILAGFAWYFYANADSFKSLLNLSLLPLIGIFIFKIIRIYNTGQFLRSILIAWKKPISRMESFDVALISTIGNYFGLYLGGAGARAIYLKKKHGLSYTDFITTLSGQYLITFRIYSFIGLVVLVLIHLQTGVYSWIFYIVMASWLIATLFFFRSRKLAALIFNRKYKKKVVNRLSSKLQNVYEGLHEIRKDKELYSKLNRLTIYGFLITFVVIYCQFMLIDVNPSITGMVLYVILTNLSLLVSITPGGIGVREALFIFSSNLLGLSIDQVLILAVIARTTTFLVMFVSYIFVRVQSPYYSYIKKQT